MAREYHDSDYREIAEMIMDMMAEFRNEGKGDHGASQ